ncbi:efflux RND transporter periplasmic adaptor subunit [Rhodobaculum claviforme]|uniref:Efflux RND transporter periplasmic adaptor subunit n=1 Tax=Rhodobaculum claviforme TaxID=1549854 RepID=A0A934TK13_9RHOB|nr:efflux RND transporter periplasmic adaptor subunit [Rhodobaculum claviforme]MBK5926478.1 hypothetical protein [Rhodobaculum claviforme]
MSGTKRPEPETAHAPTRARTPDTAALPAVRPQPVRGDRGPRRLWWWLGAGGIGALIAALAVVQPWAPTVLPVMVERVAMAPVTRVLAVNGRIAALHSVDVRPLVGGVLTRVEVAEGADAASGDILARIDTAAQDAVLRQALAGLDAALVAQDQAEATFARALALGGNVSAAGLEADRRAVQSARQEVARMTALLEQAQVQLARHTLRAPLTGTIVALDAEPGQTVDTATVLMTLADLTDLVVETDVDEARASQIAVGQPAALRLAGEGETRAGHVRTVAGRVDTATGGLAVRIGFDAPVSAPIGLTVTANIVVDRRDAALTVPRGAVVTDGADAAVFVARDGMARRQPVTVIDWPAARLIVTDGLAPGDAVIVDAADLRDGQPVRTAQP